jgi:predicted phage-related endonuclease
MQEIKLNTIAEAILEIKCPNERTHKEALLGIVPKYYSDQIQHQFACTGACICYYVSYRPENEEKLAVVEIKPDLEYISHLIEVERKFYQENLCAFCPPTEWKLLKK